MKLLSFSHHTETGANRASFGIATGIDGADGIIDLGDQLDGVRDLSDLLAQERVGEARTIAESATPTLSTDNVIFERTLPTPGKIFCIGVNYGGRNAEYKDGQDSPDKPSVFVRFPNSFTGHEQPLVRPPESAQLDYEGEIVAVIGTGGRRIKREDARNHIAGLALGNEGTIRDWVRHAKFNVTQGKNWDSSGAIGPWMVSLDEIGDFENLHLTTHVNGELRQDDTPATMAYPIEYQVEYLSTFCTLEPGDIIFTGTPTGAGARFDPPKFLVPGDTIEVSVPELGTLRNGVRDE
ncbi:MAG: 2-keto-4-pentenoate hydratase/2-oxohepta-3-ene-1,7-dioic acid hydratase in catechol pathway [Ilumatobacter sp.]|jgi:2-keto-4-pentenoate hydratase/2-oxohepta-3-ene-1,7-dioic acid hydratase in catechol pathway